VAYSVALIRQLETVDPALRQVLLAILDEIEQQRAVTVTHDDFADLRAVVASLGEAQQRTEARMGQLAQAQQRTEARMEQFAQAQQRTEARMGQLAERMDGLAQAQQRTEASMGQLAKRMDGLAQAQQRTEASMGQLAERTNDLTAAQQRTEMHMEQLALAQAETQRELGVLGRSLADTRRQIGGVTRSTAYALENEAYRQLPKLLEERGIRVTERFVRTTLQGEEINFLAHAERDKQPVVIVGESALRLQDTNKLVQLRAHEELAREAYGLTTVPLLVTHYARATIREKFEAQGVIVVESFEWG
jgi:chromosome segregation ATPase